MPSNDKTAVKQIEGVKYRYIFRFFPVMLIRERLLKKGNNFSTRSVLRFVCGCILGLPR